MQTGFVLSRTIVVTAVPMLPARSVAVTVITLLPAVRAMLAIVQLVVPVAVPDPPSEFTHATLAIPEASDDVPAIVV